MSTYNDLTPQQEERIAVLNEECGETIHMAGKVSRHGLHSSHPDYGHITNRVNLAREAGHVWAAIELLIKAGDLDLEDVRAGRREKFERWPQFLHGRDNIAMARRLARGEADTETELDHVNQGQ